jgi:hypothetical protein
MQIFITGQNKESLNQIFRFLAVTLGQEERLLIKAIKVDTKKSLFVRTQTLSFIF